MTERIPLDAGVAKLIAEAPAHANSDPQATFDQLRDDARVLWSWMRGDLDPTLDGVAIRDDSIGTVPVRWYGPDPDQGQHLIAFIHGGGWILGDVESHDVDARYVARRTGATVISIEYRKAPEYPFPAAIDDCSAAVRGIAALPHRGLGVMGDSAGGNLAVTTALALKDKRIIDAVLALFPVIDAEAMSNTSYRENGTDYLLTTAAMELYWNLYATTDDARRNPLASPARADLAGLPPFVIATADYDPLRDEGKALAARLAAADVDVTYLPNPGLIHGFQQMTPRIPAATRALDAAYDAFSLALTRATASRRNAPAHATRS